MKVYVYIYETPAFQNDDAALNRASVLHCVAACCNVLQCVVVVQKM